jgi:flagellar hook-associated protein 2
MTTIDSDYVQQISTQLATFEVQSAVSTADRNEANYSAQLTAITSLDTALKAFSSTVSGMNTTSSSVLTNSASFSAEGYASATVDTTAVEGSYQFFVEQLATNHQLGLQGLSDGDIDNSGLLTISQNGIDFSIDLSTIDSDSDGSNSLAELTAAINAATDNTGVKATLVRSNGEVSLILASESSGVENSISLATSGTGGGVLIPQ